MGIVSKIRKGASMPPRTLLRKVWRKVHAPLHAKLARHRDLARCTYTTGVLAGAGIEPVFKLPPLEILETNADTLSALAGKTLQHRFDLLGSGWRRVRHGMPCPGLEDVSFPATPAPDFDAQGEWLKPRLNASNLAYGKQLWSMLTPEYTSIDWHIDFISGYRWSEGAWSQSIPIGAPRGADIKAPWELARMQHLPQLALAYALSRNGRAGSPDAGALQEEFRNQTLDFLATNPPLFGVNWRCAMDVGIRAANLLAAVNLFTQAGAEFDAPFIQVLGDALYAHGCFIINHLEYDEDFRGNHYLSNVAGLAYIAAALPTVSETDLWLAFATQEILKELPLQFLPDGSNFEASTSYHRLSAELAAYTLALILGLPEERYARMLEYDPAQWRARPRLLPPGKHPLAGIRSGESPVDADVLKNMAFFARDVSYTPGRAIQIGDTDNGRFFKFQPVYSEFPARDVIARYENIHPELEESGEYEGGDYLYEEHLDFRPLMAALDVLEPGACDSDVRAEFSLERSMVQGVAGIASAPAPEIKPDLSMPNAEVREYPDFGLIVLRTPRAHATIRCGSVGQNDRGGHAHQDQLAITLSVDDALILGDPGSYVYTPLPEARNSFRSSNMHSTIQPPQGKGPGVSSDLFYLPDAWNGRIISVDASSCLAGHTGFGAPCRREIRLESNALHVRDRCDVAGVFLRLCLAPGMLPHVDSPTRALIDGAPKQLTLECEQGAWVKESNSFSPAYGWALPTIALKLEGFKKEVRWRIEW